MRTVAIINQKGGCGKTTSAINLSAVLASRGFKTLLVDLDPQSHCAAGLAVPENKIDRDIGDAMVGPQDAKIDTARLLWRISKNLDLAPSRTKMAGLEASRGGLADLNERERRLASVLKRIDTAVTQETGRSYDVCVLDCPPSIGLLTYNALTAAREVLIPVETSFFSLQGASKQVSTIRSIGRRLGERHVYRLLATIHETSSPLAQDLLDALRGRFGTRVLPRAIRSDMTLREAASYGQPVIDFAPMSMAADDYRALAEWLIDYLGRDGFEAPDEFADDQVEDLANEALDELADDDDDLPEIDVRPLAVAAIERSRAGGAADLPRQAMREPGREAGLDAVELEQQRGPVTSPERDRAAAAVSDMERVRAALMGSAAPTPSAAPSAVPAQQAVSPAPAAVPVERALSENAVAQKAIADLAAAAPTATEPSRLADIQRRARVMHQVGAVEPDMEVKAASGALRLVGPKAAPRPEESVARLFGVRATEGRVLFVQPITLGKVISVAGTFNEWSSDTHVLRRNEALGVHELTIPVEPGIHRYRLVIDGVWGDDPHNERSEQNEFGETNNVFISTGIKGL